MRINPEDLPSVSVIVPVRNEEQHIERCVRQLLEQSYPVDKLEILIVDGMSEDRTSEIVRRMENGVGDGSITETAEGERAKGLNAPIRLLDNENGQRASAMNVGFRGATGEVVIRVDARTVLPENYLTDCVETLVKTGADNVGGIQKPISTNPAQAAIGLAMSHPFGVGNAQFRVGKTSGFVDTVYLGCFKK